MFLTPFKLCGFCCMRNIIILWLVHFAALSLAFSPLGQIFHGSTFPETIQIFDLTTTARSYYITPAVGKPRTLPSTCQPGRIQARKSARITVSLPILYHTIRSHGRFFTTFDLLSITNRIPFQCCAFPGK